MEITHFEAPGLFTLKPKVFEDSRGYFFESFHRAKFSEITGLTIDFVQDNESSSSYGVIRGLHMQVGHFAQAKFIRVVEGEILDVALDVRPDSPTFGRYFTQLLSAENKVQFFIPHGFLHGFSVLSPRAVVQYKCDNYYDKSSERGVLPVDKELSIDWKIPADKRIISEKDAAAPTFEAFKQSILSESKG